MRTPAGGGGGARGRRGASDKSVFRRWRCAVGFIRPWRCAVGFMRPWRCAVGSVRPWRYVAGCIRRLVRVVSCASSERSVQCPFAVSLPSVHGSNTANTPFPVRSRPRAAAGPCTPHYVVVQIKCPGLVLAVGFCSPRPAFAESVGGRRGGRACIIAQCAAILNPLPTAKTALETERASCVSQRKSKPGRPGAARGFPGPYHWNIVRTYRGPA